MTRFRLSCAKVENLQKKKYKKQITDMNQYNEQVIKF